MTNTPGNETVIVDADALIGLIHQDDALHKTCSQILIFLNQNNCSVVMPYAIVLEASTTLSRSRISRPDLAESLLNYYLIAEKGIKNLNFEVADLVAEIYDPKSSKKNTPFDHYVLALAKKNNIKYVFSFDTFYEKNGLTLAEDLLKQ